MPWHEIILSGSAHVIPRVCPNCLSDGDAPVRVASWSGDMKYSQTFYYCRACAVQVEAEQSYEARECSGLRLIRGGSVLGFFLAVPIMVAGAVLSTQWRDEGNETMATIALVIGVAGLFAGAILGILVAKRRSLGRLHRAKERYPLREGQALWGTAARLWGQRYLACRWEWLQLLAEANTDAIDGPSYELAFGTPKPSAPERKKPFPD